MSLFDPPPPDESFAQRAKDAVTLLDEIIANRGLLTQLPEEERRRLLMAAGMVAKPDSKARTVFNRANRRRERKERRAKSEAQLDQTGIRRKRAEAVYQTPRLRAPQEILDQERAWREEPKAKVRIEEGRNCYVCKQRFEELHHFYDQMCPSCAAFNYTKRFASADLSGRTALVTGSRVKIGYHVAVKLLRAGASVICTTRFPRDAASRYAQEEDFADWKDRLEIFGLDLRHTPSVETFCEHLKTSIDRLDFLINNACQTVRRPPAFYEHLMAAEARTGAALPEACRPLLASYEDLRSQAQGRLPAPGAANTAERIMSAPGLVNAPEMARLALLPEDLADQVEGLFPEGRLDQDLQQVDLREKNSWRLSMAEVSTVELLEVHLINAVAPYVLNARLKPLMLRVPTADKHIVNVSAVEGQFYRTFKTDKHPHTNMAKASLNMMTRTSAADYIKDGIHMNAVDTGWVTDEDPVELAARKRVEQRFTPPLDIVDGAARILDPIIDGFNTGEHVWGQFLKDYKPTPW